MNPNADVGQTPHFCCRNRGFSRERGFRESPDFAVIGAASPGAIVCPKRDIAFAVPWVDLVKYHDEALTDPAFVEAGQHGLDIGDNVPP
jgi:hypothetical protein